MKNSITKNKEVGAARKTEERTGALERAGGISSEGEGRVPFHHVLVTSVESEGEGCICSVEILSAGQRTGLSVTGALCLKGIFVPGDQALMFDGPEGSILVSGTGDFTSNITNNITNLNVTIYMGWGEAGS